jgi:molybdate transport system regulatory protein
MQTIPFDEELKLQLRLRRGKDIVMGPGRAELLGQIEATGSIAAAGRRMGMSYKRAWALVESMNSTFRAPLVEAAKGGVGGGGARLTATGTEILAAYRGFERVVAESGAAYLEVLNAALTVPPEGKEG